MIHVSNALGHHQPGRRASTARAQAAGAVVSSTARRPSPHMPVDVQAIGCDFYAFSGHKIYGPDGHRRALRTRGAARRDAALPGRRRHDRLGDLREDRLQRAAATSSRPARRTSPASSASARRCGYVEGLDRAAAQAHEDALLGVTPLAACAASPACASSAETAQQARACCRSSSTACIPHDIGTILDARGHRGPHGPALRAAGDGSLRRAGDGARVDRPLQHARRDRPSSWRACTRSARCSADVGPAGALPGSDPRPQQAAEELRRDRAPVAHGEGHNPLCGDRLTLHVTLDGDRITDVGVRGIRLRDLEGVGVADDRSRQGQDRRRGRRRSSSRFHDARDARRLICPRQTEGLGKLAAFAGVRGVSRPREVRQPGVAHAEERRRRPPTTWRRPKTKPDEATSRDSTPVPRGDAAGRRTRRPADLVRDAAQTSALEPQGPCRHQDGVRPRDPGQHPRPRPHLRRHRRCQRCSRRA